MEIMWCSTAMWDYYQTVHSPRYIPFQCHAVLVLFASRTSSPVSLLIMERRRRERFTKGRTWIRKDRGAVSKQWSIYIYHLTLFREIFSNETWGHLGLNHQIWGSISNIDNISNTSNTKWELMAIVWGTRATGRHQFGRPRHDLELPCWVFHGKSSGHPWSP